MSISENDLLRRFDVVFRTILVVATITISAALAFYKEILPSYAFLYSIVFFAAAISIWAYSTFRGGTGECVLKIVAWWTLMSAFTLQIARLAFSSFYLPPLVTTVAVSVALMLTWPLFRYFRCTMLNAQERYVKKGLKIGLLVIFLAEVIGLIITSTLSIT